MLPKFLVPSYLLTGLYILGDTADKFTKTLNRSKDSMQATLAALDTLVWQTAASCVLPGLTIRVIVTATSKLLTRGRLSASLPFLSSSSVRQYGPTAVGLASIPLIIHPIDKSVNWVMEKEARVCSRFYVKRPERWDLGESKNEKDEKDGKDEKDERE